MFESRRNRRVLVVLVLWLVARRLMCALLGLPDSCRKTLLCVQRAGHACVLGHVACNSAHDVVPCSTHACLA